MMVIGVKKKNKRDRGDDEPAKMKINDFRQNVFPQDDMIWCDMLGEE